MSRFGDRSYRGSWMFKFRLAHITASVGGIKRLNKERDRDSFRFPTLQFPSNGRDSEIAPTVIRGCANLRLTHITASVGRIKRLIKECDRKSRAIEIPSDSRRFNSRRMVAIRRSLLPWFVDV